MLVQKLFLVSFILFSGVIAVNASEEGRARELIISHAKAALNQKDYITAIEDFSRALILDPEDQNLQDNLILINQQENLPLETALQLNLLEDFIRQNNNLKEKISFYKNDQTDLKSKIHLSGSILKSSDSKMILNIDDRAVENNQSLLILNSIWEQKIAALKQELFTLQQNVKYLHNVHEANNEVGQLAQESSELSQNRMFKFYDQWGNRVDGLYENKVNMVSDNSQSDQMNQMKKMLNKLVEQDESQENQLIKFKQEVVNLTLIVNEKNTQLELASEGLDLLRAQLMDVQSRFDLSQRLLNQKDLDVQEIQNKLKEIDSMVIKLKEKDDALAKSDQVIKQQKKRIEDLTIEVFSLNVKLEKEKGSKDLSLKNTNDSYSVTDQLQKLHKTLSNKNNLLSTMQDNLLLLKNQMTSLQDKLIGLDVPNKLPEERVILENSFAHLKDYVRDMNNFLDNEIKSFETNHEQNQNNSSVTSNP